MKNGWVGNRRLQALVLAGEAVLVPEVVELEDAHVKDVKADWEVATDSGGTPLYLDSGGATIEATSAALIAEVANDGATLNNLTHIPTFNAVMVTWSGSRPEDIEIHNMVARMDPRRDGGQAKTVSVWEAQLFRVTRILQGGIEEGGFTVSPISRPVRVTASGEAPADFTFNFEALGGGGYPRVGLPPTGAVLTDANPRTMVRIIGLQSDGSPATNVAWMANSGQSEASSPGSYLAESVSVLRLSSAQAQEIGGTAYKLTTGADYPEFTLGQAEYVETVLTFDGGNEVPALSGSGSVVVVARGETPSDSAITYEISDDGGANWFECFDGDVLATDNSADGGGNLTAVNATGPWDIRVTLTPSTAADLNAPTVREFGLERVVSTILRGAAEFTGGARAIDVVTLKGEIAAAALRIAKAGENDYRDYGSNILARSHIGQITVRIWVADKDGSQLLRREWMLHSAWDVDDYFSTDTHHVIALISPLRRIHSTIIPPFVVTTGNDGTRTAVEVSGTLKAAYEEILDSMLAVATRFRGPGLEDATNTVAKLLTRSHAKEELDQLANLDGSAIIESQGRITAVKVIRDGPGGDTPVAFFPHGSYEAGDFGPGYSTRTDEFFVRYNWNEALEFFEDERRYVNGVAFTRLGGVGVNTTQELDEETCKWITTQALADLVGERVPYHFATGQIIWPIHSIGAHPELNPGDPVAIETTRFVGRSPLSDEEIRGRVSALAIVVGVKDEWGRDLELWVPSFDKIVPATGTVTREGFFQALAPFVSDASTDTHTGDTSETTLRTEVVPARSLGTDGGFELEVVFDPSGTAGAKTGRVRWGGSVIGSVQFGASDTDPVTLRVKVRNVGSMSVQRITEQKIASGGAMKTEVHDDNEDTSVDQDIDISCQLSNAADSLSIVDVTLTFFGTG